MVSRMAFDVIGDLFVFWLANSQKSSHASIVGTIFQKVQRAIRTSMSSASDPNYDLLERKGVVASSAAVPVQLLENKANSRQVFRTARRIADSVSSGLGTVRRNPQLDDINAKLVATSGSSWPTTTMSIKSPHEVRYSRNPIKDRVSYLQNGSKLLACMQASGKPRTRRTERMD